MRQPFWITHCDHLSLQHLYRCTLQATQLGQAVPQAAESEVLENGADELLLELDERELSEVKIDGDITHQRHQVEVEGDLVRRRHNVLS